MGFRNYPRDRSAPAHQVHPISAALRERRRRSEKRESLKANSLFDKDAFNDANSVEVGNLHNVELHLEHGFDLCLIETMPLGDIEGDRTDQYLPLSTVRSRLRQTWTLSETEYKTGGPARYFTVAQTGSRIGFITPMTHNFCESCNRVRLTCTGTLYMCLGQDDQADFRRILRAGATDDDLDTAILAAIAHKPQGHDFVIDRRSQKPALARHMSVTGG